MVLRQGNADVWGKNIHTIWIGNSLHLFIAELTVVFSGLYYFGSLQEVIENMADIDNLNACLAVCGFTAAQAGRMNVSDGMVSLAGIAELNDEEVANWVREARSRPQAQRLLVGAGPLKNFKTLQWWVRDRQRRGQALDAAAVATFDAAAMEMAAQRKKVEKTRIEEAKKDTSDPPDFVSGTGYPQWRKDYAAWLDTKNGQGNIPLGYVIRPAIAPAEFANWEEQLKFEARLDGPEYEADSKRVLQMIRSTLDPKKKSIGYPTIQPFERRAQGREAMLALDAQYGGGGEQKKQVAAAKAALKGLHYRDESVFSMETYTSTMTDELQTMEEGGEGLTETQKVEMLIAGIKNEDKRFLYHVEHARSTYSADYEGAVLYLCEQAANLFPMNPKKRPRLGVGSVETDRQRGGGPPGNDRYGGGYRGYQGRGGRGGGRGGGYRGGGRGRGRGYGRGGGGHQKNWMCGVDITDVTRDFSSEEREKLWKGNAWRWIMEERARKNKRKYGDDYKPRGGDRDKREVGAVGTDDKEKDKDDSENKDSNKGATNGSRFRNQRS